VRVLRELLASAMPRRTSPSARPLACLRWGFQSQQRLTDTTACLPLSLSPQVDGSEGSLKGTLTGEEMESGRAHMREW